MSDHEEEVVDRKGKGPKKAQTPYEKLINGEYGSSDDEDDVYEEDSESAEAPEEEEEDFGAQQDQPSEEDEEDQEDDDEEDDDGLVPEEHDPFLLYNDLTKDVKEVCKDLGKSANEQVEGSSSLKRKLDDEENSESNDEKKVKL